MENHIRFFTATIVEWRSLLQSDKYKNIIMNSLKFMVEQKRIWLYGFVIMPNHVHALWRMQEEIKEENVKRDFLKFTSQSIKFDLIDTNSPMLNIYKKNAHDREYQFWKKKAYSSTMYNRKVVEQKLDYIHANPLQKKWKLCEAPEDYYYSSAKYYLLNQDDWGFITHYTEHISSIVSGDNTRQR